MCLVGDDVFYADGQTDTTRLTVTLRNFVNIQKNLANVLLASIKILQMS